MPFANAHHRTGGREPLDLAARIEAELRSRIEDAIDYACLDAMVTARRARGAHAPVADSPADRDEYHARVVGFLERLRVTIGAALDDAQRRRLASVLGPRPASDVPGAIAAQVALARELPDYWQRFEAVRRQDGDGLGSGGSERRSLLDRLLGRG